MNTYIKVEETLSASDLSQSTIDSLFTAIGAMLKTSTTYKEDLIRVRNTLNAVKLTDYIVIKDGKISLMSKTVFEENYELVEE